MLFESVDGKALFSSAWCFLFYRFYSNALLAEKVLARALFLFTAFHPSGGTKSGWYILMMGLTSLECSVLLSFSVC